MSNSLLAKIKADAAVRVKEIEERSSQASETRRAQTATALRELQNEAASALEKEKAQQKLVVRSKAKQTQKLAVQSAKREAINAVFADAFKKLVNQPADEYVASYTKRWQEAVPADAILIAVTAPAGREKETSEILAAVAARVEPTYVDTIASGVIVTTKAGVYDLTLDRRFSEARPELEMVVVAAAAR